MAKDWRLLTLGERRLVAQVFGTAINPVAVRVYSRGFLPFQSAGTAMAPDGNIYFTAADYKADFSTSFNDAVWLIHELVHVWQSQTGRWVMLRGIVQAGGYAYGKLDAAKPLSDYKLEQQGDIVADYYRLRRGKPLKSGSGTRAEYEAVIPFLPPATRIQRAPPAAARQVATQRR